MSVEARTPTERDPAQRTLRPFARGPVLAVAALVGILLLAVSGRYGYHRDELYFLAAGRHLAWGYADQPPLVPLLARIMSWLAPDSVVVLRLPSVAAALVVVVVTAWTARELGGGRAAQTVASASMALAALLLGACHLLSTTTFDLVAWSVVLYLVVRILRTGDDRLWLAVGLVAGIGLLDSDLVAFLAAGLGVGVLAAGPRRTFRSPWLWAGVVVAGGMWAPYLAWQAAHGWPQLDVSRAIAAGQSGTSQPRTLFVPYQFLIAGPVVAPVWVAGLVRLARDPALRAMRCLALAYAFLVAVFIASGGKPYYIGGMFPLLFAAGGDPAAAWLRRHRPRVAVAAVALSLPAALFALPVAPVADVGRLHLASLNYDMGEQIAWPVFVDEIAGVVARLPADRRARAQILTSNYGEAGAVARYGPRFGLPTAFSGETGYWYWGPPSATHTIVAVGFDRARLRRYFTRVVLATRLDNHLGVDDDEQGRPVWVCTDLRGRWSSVWPRLRAF